MGKLKFLAIGVSLLTVWGCANPTATTHTGLYQITGSATSVNVVYNGGSSSGVPLPWTYTFSAPTGTYVLLDVENESACNTTVNAKIFEDGNQVAQNSGTYNCQGTVSGNFVDCTTTF